MIYSIYVFVFLALACSNNITDQNISSANSSATAETRNSELQKQIEQIAAAAKGKVGVEAKVLETGETISLNSKEKFPMQSVYKFPIGMAVLRQIDDGKLTLDQKVKVEKTDFVGERQHSPIRDKNPNGVELSVSEILRSAVSESDGTAADVLIKVIGGTQEVDKYLKRLGINEVIVANTEKEIGQNWETQYRNTASPENMVALLKAFHEGRGLSPQSKEVLLKMMTETPTGMKRLKGLLPAETRVAHKTGTSRTQEGITAATNDVGIITLPNGKHLAIAVFVADSPADDATREEVIAKIAEAVFNQWSK